MQWVIRNNEQKFFLYLPAQILLGCSKDFSLKSENSSITDSCGGDRFYSSLGGDDCPPPLTFPSLA